MSDELPELTDRQQQVLDYIQSHITEKGCSPTIREIGKAFGIVSPNGVMCHLKALEKKGRLTRSGDLHRGIILTANETIHRLYDFQEIKIGPATIKVDIHGRDEADESFVTLTINSPYTPITESE